MGFSKSLFFFFFFCCYCATSGSSSSTTGKTSRISRFNVPTMKIQPYEWTYIRVELSNAFSSASIAIDSDVNLDLDKFYLHPDKSLPIICFRDGGPPLPDFSKASLKALVMSQYNGSAENIQYLQNVDQCYPMQKKIRFKLLYGQFVPGIYYFGLFNGLGPIRTQSKMIESGSPYSFSANVTVEGCSNPAMKDQHCDQTVEDLTKVYVDHTDGNVQKFSRNFCLVKEEPKIYSLDTDIGLQMTISLQEFSFNQTHLNMTSNANELSLMCYARFKGIVDSSLFDYSYDLRKGPLVIPTPKSGMWYFAFQAVYHSKVEIGTESCISVEWKTSVCPETKEGSNCIYEEYSLKGVYQNNPTIPHIYFPGRIHVDTKLANFPLESLLSKSSDVEQSGHAWTYFLLDTPPRHIEGMNLHIQLSSDTKLNYELYVRFRGLPTVDTWDISYSNLTAKSKSNSMVKLYGSSERRVNLYILYPRNENWVIGLRHPVSAGNSSRLNTRMSVSAKLYPNQCSYQGTEQARYDGSRTINYHYCSCDRDHGGFDCSINILSRAGRIWHWTCIIGSNIAAILPASRAFQQKAFADFIIFMCSGISSALYHACDVGYWCILEFHILQFMDFWLSFLAVVSTFVSLCNVSEAAKRTMHTIATISSALMALTGATRSSNIPVILSMGAAGLLIGWLMEFCTTNKLSTTCNGTTSSSPKRYQNVKEWLLNLGKTLHGYLHWSYVILGFFAFSVAVISRVNENSQNYWILHSLWHISIYTCAFFFFCSKKSK